MIRRGLKPLADGLAVLILDKKRAGTAVSAKVYLWNQRLYRRFFGCFLYFLFIGGKTSKMGLKFWVEMSSLLNLTCFFCRISVMNRHSAQPRRLTCNFDLIDASMSSAFNIVFSPFSLVTMKCSHFDQITAPNITVCSPKLIIMSLLCFYLSVRTIARLRFIWFFVNDWQSAMISFRANCQKWSPVID